MKSVKSINELKELLPDPLAAQEKILEEANKKLLELGLTDTKALFIKNRILYIEVPNSYIAQLVCQKTEEIRRCLSVQVKSIRTRCKNG
ncbi:MAG: hypothetical protein JXA60_12535 [Candidatus Coatesbacteria bacterium]|nr:hypothetical protein [Candidatus Coatesbacteria bacterium]